MAYKPGDFAPEDGIYVCSCDKKEEFLKKGQSFPTCEIKNHIVGNPTEWTKKE